MINIGNFVSCLEENGVSFFTGVPDSLLNGFCKYLERNLSPDKHVIAANEGNAIATACGYYFSTGKIPLVYMQNSGIGNALNPLVSLADKNVYSVPMVLLIGWRGEPDRNDWPQHKTQGIITPKVLDDMEIPYLVLENDDEKAAEAVHSALSAANKNQSPFALLVKKGVCDGDKEKTTDTEFPLSREDAIKVILETLPEDTLFVATTGRATRELYYLREEAGQSHQYDLLNVGAMGHVLSIAVGISLGNKERKVVCLDGDSAAIMHMGGMTTVSKVDVPNLMHIVLNNGSHESVGGQLSAGRMVDLTSIADSCGFNTIGSAVSEKEELISVLRKLSERDGPSFIDVHIRKGMRDNLKPLDIDHHKLIEEFMNETIKRGV